MVQFRRPCSDLHCMVDISLQNSTQLLTFNMVVQLSLPVHFAKEEAVHLASRLEVMETLAALLKARHTILDIAVLADLLDHHQVLLAAVASVDLLDHHQVVTAAEGTMHLQALKDVGSHLPRGHHLVQQRSENGSGHSRVGSVLRACRRMNRAFHVLSVSAVEQQRSQGLWTGHGSGQMLVYHICCGT